MPGPAACRPFYITAYCVQIFHASVSDCASLSVFGESASMDINKPKIRKTARIAPTIIINSHLLCIGMQLEGQTYKIWDSKVVEGFDATASRMSS
jgi:hypothetical protein